MNEEICKCEICLIGGLCPKETGKILREMRAGNKCKECKEYFADYSIIQKGSMKGSRCSNPGICQECMGKGWSEVTLQDMRDDPELFGEIKIKSSYENI